MTPALPPAVVEPTNLITLDMAEMPNVLVPQVAAPVMKALGETSGGGNGGGKMPILKTCATVPLTEKGP